MNDRGFSQKSENLPTLLVWDVEDPPPVDSGKTVLWRSFGDGVSPEIISIPKLVEKNADALRRQYLSWVYELGETQIQGQRLIDHLKLRPGFSYWWMTLFVEKCNYSKSPHIDHAIRLMALEAWAVGQSFRRLILATSNAQLATCICSWCNRAELSFEWRRLPTETTHVSWLRRTYGLLSREMQAFAWLALYVIRRWPLKGGGLAEWRLSAGRTTFVSYLFNLEPDAVNEGRFKSYYWAHLPDDLRHNGFRTNWLHLYLKDAVLPNARKAAAAIHRFNSTAQSGQVHVTLDTFLGWSVVFKSVGEWFRLRRLGRVYQRRMSADRGTTINLWPLFQEDWKRSFSGEVAMSNVLNCNLLQSALCSLPKQRFGVYLQENQGWELAFIHAWKAAGHGHLVGTPHSTVRFWDLRYFFDPRSYARTGKNDLPMPDQVALNGAAAFGAYLDGRYPERDLVAVEALRYLHLARSPVEKIPMQSPSHGPLRVLVLGDYRLSRTRQQLRLLGKVVQRLPLDTIFVVKPHPACPVQPDDYPGLKLQVTMNPVSNLLTDFDIAYTGDFTSAAVDAYCAGVPVISLLDPSSLNLSPLRGCDGVRFVSTPDELACALISAAKQSSCAASTPDYFWLNPTMSRWKHLLGVNANFSAA